MISWVVPNCRDIDAKSPDTRDILWCERAVGLAIRTPVFPLMEDQLSITYYKKLLPVHISRSYQHKWNLCSLRALFISTHSTPFEKSAHANTLTGAFLVSQIIATAFVIPVGMIQAVTNIQIGLNVITEFIVGYMLPGRPLAMMMFKMFGYITMSQALAFASDLKLAHYLKIPPRTIFWAQVVATAWTRWVFPMILDAKSTSLQIVAWFKLPLWTGR